MAEAISIPDASSTRGAAHARGESNRGLLLVGLFKLSKAIFFGAMAAGALHLIHSDVGDLVMRLVNDQRMVDPEGHFVSVLMDKADLINGHMLRQTGMLSAMYSIVCVIEGTGLMMRKVWAEYFTVILTVAALPYEIYELIDHYSNFKVGLIVLNLIVLFYLLWILKRTRQKREACLVG